MNFTDILTNGLISYSGSTASYILGAIAVALISYLVGSVNFAVILSKSRGEDIRTVGSGNAGTTNIMRTYGKGMGVAVFIGDFLKSALCVFIGMLLMPADGFSFVAAFFCMIGHVYPIYFGFRGGKGVAVFVGAMVCLNPPAAVFSIVVYVLLLTLFKYVSLASISMSLVFPIINFYLPFSMFRIKGDAMDERALINYVLCMMVPIIMAIFVCITHVSNIRRLIDGTERKVGEKKK